MIKYILKRIMSVMVVLWAVISLTFFMMHAIPGGPFTLEKKLPLAVLAKVEERYHLNDPLLVQYKDYLLNVVKFDLGPSYQYEGRTVNDIIDEAFPVSAQLGLGALIVSLAGGLAAGIFSALRPNSWVDYLVTLGSTLGISVPSFITGALLAYIFGYKLQWFPAAMWLGPSYMVLPILTLSAQPMAYVARLTRAGLVEVMHSDYIRTARAKGLSLHQIVLKHALGNAILPVVTYVGPLAAALMTGSFIVETIFAIPGLGSYFVNSIYNRDYTLTLGITIFYSVLIIIFNFVVDIAYSLIDPRVKVEADEEV